MARLMTNDLDYLAARLHGRRSRLAEAERLDGLCGLQTIPELGRAIYPGAEFHAVADFQSRLAQDLVREMCGYLRHLDGAGRDLLAWMLVRFQVENIKVLLRGVLSRTPIETLEAHLIVLPRDLALDTQSLVTAKSLKDFADRLPAGAIRASMREAADVYHDQTRPFFLEAALDGGYLRELLARTGQLPDEDKELIQPIVLQEVNTFHLMLVVRGRFFYGVPLELLLPLHIRGSGISRGRFSAMLSAPDIRNAVSVAVGKAIDDLLSGRESNEASIDPATLEALAWKRYLRLSNRAFRRSHMGLGAVVGYVGIRRVEVANLITLSEGVRTGTTAEAIRKRLIPRTDLEAVHV